MILDVIHFLHYYCSEQINNYRQYCRRSTKYPKLIIDATGSVVKPFEKLNSEKTNKIFLYEGIVYDEQKKYSFTATNMLSERHTNLAIANWLNSDVPVPKQTVCDQSIALYQPLLNLLHSTLRFKIMLEHVQVYSTEM